MSVNPDKKEKRMFYISKFLDKDKMNDFISNNINLIGIDNGVPINKKPISPEDEVEILMLNDKIAKAANDSEKAKYADMIKSIKDKYNPINNLLESKYSTGVSIPFDGSTVKTKEGATYDELVRNPIENYSVRVRKDDDGYFLEMRDVYDFENSRSNFSDIAKKLGAATGGKPIDIYDRIYFDVNEDGTYSYKIIDKSKSNKK